MLVAEVLAVYHAAIAGAESVCEIRQSDRNMCYIQNLVFCGILWGSIQQK